MCFEKQGEKGRGQGERIGKGQKEGERGVKEKRTSGKWQKK